METTKAKTAKTIVPLSFINFIILNNEGLDYRILSTLWSLYHTAILLC